MNGNFFNKENFGKLFIRMILGIILTAKGIYVFVGGRTALLTLGKILAAVGVTFWPLYFGWAIAVICVVCGIMFAIGAFFKTSAFLLGTVILLETVFKYYASCPLVDSVAISAMLSAAMYGLLFIGPGTYAVDKG
ncbi:MAG: hypothetical protein LBI61_01860 [Puniceicoccales bacterium]|jgi:putative oxidoreductase|nr:hypothetical protein [Puniceicoccales bacterium]